MTPTLPSSKFGELKTTFNFAKASVLMVDSNTTCLEVLSQILSGFGFRKFDRHTSLDGVEDIVRSCSLDLILIDPYGLKQNAFDFVRWVRTESLGTNSACPVMMVTAHTEMRNISLAKECGADFVIAKPFAPIVLLERILWVAKGEGRGGFMAAPQALMSPGGSGVELW